MRSVSRGAAVLVDGVDLADPDRGVDDTHRFGDIFGALSASICVHLRFSFSIGVPSQPIRHSFRPGSFRARLSAAANLFAVRLFLLLAPR